MNEYLKLLNSSLPELALTLTAFVALGADLAWLRRKEALSRLRTAGNITLAGLVVAAALIFVTVTNDAVSLYHGMMAINPFTAFFKLVVIGLAVLVTVVSMEHEFTRHVGEYFAVLLFGTIGMMLLVSAEELIMIFVALELTSICLYILTAFHKGALRSAEAAVKYFMFGALSSAFLLYGLSWIYGVTGATSLSGIRGALGEGTAASNLMVLVGVLFATVGFGFKVAVVPFHLWAPDAYEGAPTPVTAFIATGSKVASFIVVAKFLVLGFAAMAGQSFWQHVVAGWSPVLAILAALSMVVGNCAAIVQKNIKRLLAYSSIAHAGYIFVGLIAAGSLDPAAREVGLSSLLYYIVIYGLTNLGAFGVVHALAVRAGGDDLEDFNGMAQRAPFLSLLLLVFVLSLTGVPPLAGFFGKFYLFAAAVQAEPKNLGLLWLVWIAVITSAISLYYYLILLKHVYVREAKQTERISSTPPLQLALALTCLGVILLGVFPAPLIELVTDVLRFLPL